MTKYGHKILSCQNSHSFFPVVLLELFDEPFNKPHTLVFADAEQTETLHPPATETEIDPPIETDVQIACARKLTHHCKNNDIVPRVEDPKRLNKEGRTEPCSKPPKLIVLTVILSY